MNVILVMSDSFRKDHIACLGNRKVITPALDRFVSQSTSFPNYRMGSYPTIPQRTDMFTGVPSWPDRPWQPLKKEDVVLAEVLARAGVSTFMSADTPHLFRSAQMTFTRGFDAFHWSRGSEADFFWSDYYDERSYVQPTGKGRVRMDEAKYRRIWAQRQRRVRESDWITPQTFEAAIDWLTRNYRRENFFLYIDTFDPHEPWDPPRWLTDLYVPDYDGEAFSWAEYGSADQFGTRELGYLQALYAAECTMVDRWFGRLVDTVDLLGIAEETMVVFTSDHGHYLGYPNDGGQIGKWTGYRTSDGMMAHADADVFIPLLDSVSNPVLVVRRPGGSESAVRTELVQPVDIMSTILDCFSVGHPKTVTGSSILPLIDGEKVQWRETAITADHSLFAQITDGRWLYGAWVHNNPPKLFDKQSDPDQTTDVLAQNVDVAKELHAKLVGEMRRLGAPKEQVDSIDAKARYL